MKIVSTREIWTLKTGKQIELVAEEIEEIAQHFAPTVDVDLPPIPGTANWAVTNPAANAAASTFNPQEVRGFTNLALPPTGPDGIGPSAEEEVAPS